MLDWRSFVHPYCFIKIIIWKEDIITSIRYFDFICLKTTEYIVINGMAIFSQLLPWICFEAIWLLPIIYIPHPKEIIRHIATTLENRFVFLSVVQSLFRKFLLQYWREYFLAKTVSWKYFSWFFIKFIFCDISILSLLCCFFLEKENSY